MQIVKCTHCKKEYAATLENFYCYGEVLRRKCKACYTAKVREYARKRADARGADPKRRLAAQKGIETKRKNGLQAKRNCISYKLVHLMQSQAWGLQCQITTMR